MNTYADDSRLFKGIILSILGLLLVLFPVRVLNLMSIVVGILALVTGLISLFQYIRRKDGSGFMYIMLFESVLDIILGIILIIFPETTMLIVSILLGIWVITGGILNVFSSVYARQLKQQNWWQYLIMGILIIILGIIMFVHPVFTMKTFLILIGLLLLVFGGVNLYRHIQSGL